MTPDYRALCAELVELCTPVDSIPQLAERLQKLNALADRARALLAEPEAEGPTDEELLDLADDSDLDRFEGERSYPDGTVIKEGYWEAWDHQLLAFARAVLARWGRPTPQPVTDPGKVEELVADLNEIAGILCGMEKHRWAVKLTRAAELLEQHHPASVPLIELPQGWHMLSDIEPEPGAMCEWVIMAPWGCDHGSGEWRDYDGVSPCEFFDVPVGWSVRYKGFANADGVMVSDPELTAWRMLPLPAMAAEARL